MKTRVGRSATGGHWPAQKAIPSIFLSIIKASTKEKAPRRRFVKGPGNRCKTPVSRLLPTRGGWPDMQMIQGDDRHF
jgi:hypothetical protein